MIRRKNNNLQFIAHTQRLYDALQFPLMIWKAQDGYCINIKQRDPATGAETNNNVTLCAIEDLCIIIANLPFSHFGMHSPNQNASDLINTELNSELQYNAVKMVTIVARNVPLMNEEQRTIYDPHHARSFRRTRWIPFFGCTRWYWQNIPYFAYSCKITIKFWDHNHYCIIWHCNNFIGSRLNFNSAFKLSLNI